MKKSLLPIILTAALVGTGAATSGYFVSQNQFQKEISEIQNQIKEKEEKIQDLKQQIKKQKEKEEKNSEKNRNSLISPKGFFKIELPQSGDTITSPLRVKGWANVFEGQFQVRIKDISGNVLGFKSVIASSGAPSGGVFDITITFNQPDTTQKGTVEIYSISAKDGSIDDILKIQVIIKGK